MGDIADPWHMPLETYMNTAKEIGSLVTEALENDFGHLSK
jgi:hypothetical protein